MQPSPGFAGAPPETQVAAPALCVDLDGTLVATDMLWETLIAAFRRTPWILLFLPFWLLQGRARFKTRLAAAAGPLDVARLPYRIDLLEWLRNERAAGRKLVLISASDQTLVSAIALHLGIFDDALGSTANVNLKGATKLARLRALFPDGFDYCGDSAADLPVWNGAVHAIVVGNSKAAQRMSRSDKCIRRFATQSSAAAWVSACRPLHWVKNLLVFVPAIAGHSLGAASLLQSLGMFVALSLCASGVYLVNDLLDLEADRHHPRKQRRALASGRITIPAALAVALALVLAAAAVASRLNPGANEILAIYFVATTLYSCYFKTLLLSDVIGLSLLYLARIIAGHIVTGIAFSPWQLAFAFLMFVSLAFGKRFSELQRLESERQAWIPGRGYRVQDADTVRTMGVSTGIATVVVFALYLNSDAAYRQYAQWELLWILVPVLLFWITRFWILAQRGAVTEDPIVFAARDRMTYLLAAFTALVLFLATRSLFPHLPVHR